MHPPTQPHTQAPTHDMRNAIHFSLTCAKVTDRQRRSADGQPHIVVWVRLTLAKSMTVVGTMKQSNEVKLELTPILGVK